MQSLFIVAALAIMLAIPVRPDRNPPPPSDARVEQLLGMWQLVKIDIGRAEVKIPIEDMNLHITPTGILALQKGERREGDDADYRIDWNAKPPTIDIMPRRAGNKMLGILKFEGDMLIMCLSMKGARPTAFTGDAETQVAVMQFKRIR